jgi:multidrug efflux pump subunit AcrB
MTGEAVISSCVEKFRAILITTGTTVCAMAPFAVDPRSAQSSLAVVLTGGLAVSTAVVLLAVPVILARYFAKKGKTC